jgi:hypothetical protein
MIQLHLALTKIDLSKNFNIVNFMTKYALNVCWDIFRYSKQIMRKEGNVEQLEHHTLTNCYFHPYFKLVNICCFPR